MNNDPCWWDLSDRDIAAFNAQSWLSTSVDRLAPQALKSALAELAELAKTVHWLAEDLWRIYGQVRSALMRARSAGVDLEARAIDEF